MAEPKVRFKRDDESSYPAWEEVSLDNILEEYKQYCMKDGSYEHVSLTKEGVVPKTERYERDFLVKDDEKKYRITHVDDICYNPANLKFGVICRNTYKDAIFSPIYVTFKIKEGFLPAFVENLVTRTNFINYAMRFQEGTVYERMAVSAEDLLSMIVAVPIYEEQNKIANFFASVNEAIDASEKKTIELEAMKKAIMKQLFSQNVRFKRDDGTSFPDWKKMLFWEAVSLNSSLVDPTKEPYCNMLHVGTANIEKNTGKLLTCMTAAEEGITSGKYLFDETCVVYSKIRPELSKATIPGFVGLCSADAYPLKPAQGILPEIILAQLLSEDFIKFATSTSARTKMPKINREELGEYVFVIPCLDEQRLIADFLSDFDNAIAAAKKKVELWKLLKKGLRQQMFV